MSDVPENVTLELLGGLIRNVLSEQRELRAEQHKQLQLLMALVEQGRRADRHLAELKDDIELMLKAELMGRLGNFETRFEGRLDELDGQIATLTKSPTRG